GTYEEIERVIAAHPDRDIKVMRQPGKGKGDAVFAGFDAARGDVLLILDGDLTMPPDQLPKFWRAERGNSSTVPDSSTRWRTRPCSFSTSWRTSCSRSPLPGS